MQRFNPWFMYTLGQKLAEVKNIPATPKDDTKKKSGLGALFSPSYTINQANTALTDLEEKLDTCLSKTTQVNIANLRNSLVLQEDNTFAKLTFGMSVKSLEDHLASDIQEMNCFLVPDPMAYRATILLEEGERLLPEPLNKDILAYPFALEDIRLAARCLAMKLWTAMGFHLARATESLIRTYYEQKVGALPEKGGQRTWHKLVEELKKQDDADTELLDNLEYVGTKYRNPYLHPDVSLDELTGPSLLAACTGVMTKLLVELK